MQKLHFVELANKLKVRGLLEPTFYVIVHTKPLLNPQLRFNIEKTNQRKQKN